MLLRHASNEWYILTLLRILMFPLSSPPLPPKTWWNESSDWPVSRRRHGARSVETSGGAGAVLGLDGGAAERRRPVALRPRHASRAQGQVGILFSLKIWLSCVSLRSGSALERFFVWVDWRPPCGVFLSCRRESVRSRSLVVAHFRGRKLWTFLCQVASSQTSAGES